MRRPLVRRPGRRVRRCRRGCRPRGATPIGADLDLTVPLPPFTIPQPADIGSLTIAVPNQPALADVPIYTQAVLDQQHVQVRLTNVVGDVTLR